MKNGKSRKEKEKKEREKYKPTFNWQGSDSRLSANCHELLAPRAGTSPRSQGITQAYGPGGEGEGAATPPQILGKSDFLGSKRKLGKTSF